MPITHELKSNASAVVGIATAGGGGKLPEAPGFALRLEEGEKVTLADGPLDVTDDGAVGVVEELDADLCNSTARAGAADDLGDFAELDGLILQGGGGGG